MAIFVRKNNQAGLIPVQMKDRHAGIWLQAFLSAKKALPNKRLKQDGKIMPKDDSLIMKALCL